ncbi:MAG: FG-GAP repeat protein [Phycisphaerales bacterium]|nr:FG-GAP repeat protein [Phycisphaerales bacterium]
MRDSVLLFASCGLAVSAPVLGQADPFAEPFPSVLDLDALDGLTGFTLVGPTQLAYAGWSLSPAGDVNGDGRSDLAIGMPGILDRTGRDLAGAVAVLLGRAPGPGAPFAPLVPIAEFDGTNGFTLTGVNDDLVGFALGAAGDINGDGLDDLATSAPYGGFSNGGGYLVLGTTGPVPVDRSISDLPGGGGARVFDFDQRQLGTSAAIVGDINADGIDDAAFGALRAGGTTGAVFVVFGRDAGSPFPTGIYIENLDGTDGFRLDGVDASDRFGRTVHRAGDMNGDGVDDMIVGAPGADPDRGQATGAAYVLFGRPGGFPASLGVAGLAGDEGFRIDGVETGDYTGRSVTLAGDINGDGLDDLAIGAPAAAPTGDRTGSTFVIFGRSTPFPPSVRLVDLDGGDGFRVNGSTPGGAVGAALAGIGDVNGDGLDDLAIGAPGLGYTPIAGEAIVIFGSRDDRPAAIDLADLDASIGFRMRTDDVEDLVGYSVAAAGDLNGDGLDDLAVGARYATPGDAFTYRAGAVYVIYGRSPGCRADLDGDGSLTIFDFLEFQNLFDAGDPIADFDGDGSLTIFDFLAYQNAFDAGCP